MVPRYREKEERRLDAASVMDSLFFDGLRLEFLSIAEAILRSIITDPRQPIYTAKLSTESSLQLDWGLVRGVVAWRGSNVLLGFRHAAVLLCSLLCFSYCDGEDVTTIRFRSKPSSPARPRGMSRRSGKESVGFIDQMWLGVFPSGVNL